MKIDAAELAQVEEQLLRGEVPLDKLKVLLETVRHYQRCRHRRGARSSSERRPTKRAEGGVKRKPQGHGRLDARDYTGAERVACQNSDLKAGGRCPASNRAGKLHPFGCDDDVELSGAAPVQAVVYEREVLRCALCLTTFTAPLPEQAHGGKFHPSADTVVSVMRYGLGMPHHRLAQWQKWVGVPLPPSTQFERMERLANAVQPIHRQLEKLAEDQALLFCDDTGVRILELQQETPPRARGTHRHLHHRHRGARPRKPDACRGVVRQRTAPRRREPRSPARTTTSRARGRDPHG